MADLEIESSPSPIRVMGRFFWELVKAFLIAIIIILPIRYFLIQPFFVRGASMEPTFDDGEYLIIDQLSYRFREPHRGEVIVFRYPNNPSQFFIKRIVGLPGETVRIAQGQVIVQNGEHPNGVVVDESTYLALGERTGGNVVMTLGSEEYFVLGDNRPASSDSRSWGALGRDEVIGRVWIRAFPVDRMTIFSPVTQHGFLGL